MAARKGIKAGLALGAAVLALAACTLSASAAEGGKHINAALYWFGSSLDPAVEWDGWTTCRAGITETLVTVNENYEIVPLLADSWEQTDDTTWKMHIREGVTFHNGKAVDGEAVRKSFERAFSMQERAVTAAKIDTIEAEGQDVIFTTTEPVGAFLANISEPMYSVVDADADTDFASAPVATGPYRVTDFEVNTYIELEKYEDYWNGASDVDTITVRNIDDDSTRGMALQSGEMDVVQRVAWTDLPVFENDGSFAVYNTQGARTRILVFNYRNEMLQDINVRKAIIESINYDALVSVLGSGVAKAGAPYPASAPYGYDTLQKQEFNAEDAAALLAESGYEDADEKYFEAQILIAEQLTQDGNYVEAYRIFVEVGADPKEYSVMAECMKGLYELGKSELSAGHINAARDIFLSLGKYKDSENQAKECLYRQAKKEYENTQYNKAIEKFGQIKDYKDVSKTLAKMENLSVILSVSDSDDTPSVWEAYNGKCPLCGEKAEYVCEFYQNGRCVFTVNCEKESGSQEIICKFKIDGNKIFLSDYNNGVKVWNEKGHINKVEHNKDVEGKNTVIIATDFINKTNNQAIKLYGNKIEKSE